MPASRPQSQLGQYSERYRSIPTPRTPSGSRRLTFGRPQSRQSDLDDEGDVTITLDTANITPRRAHRPTQHHRTISTVSRPDSRISVRSIGQDEDGRTTPFKRPESATGRRISGIPTPSERRTSGIPAPSTIRRQSTRPESPARSTSSSSFHSDTHSVTPSTSIGSMAAPTGIPRRQSGAHSALPVPAAKSGIPMMGRKSGTGIPLPR
jgi:hypothetical protein